MALENCDVTDRGTHLLVVNQNPRRRNALTPGFYAGLRAALAQAAAEPRIGAVVVTGAEGFFCAGGDLNLLMTAPQMPEAERRGHIEDLQSLIAAFRLSSSS